MKAKGGCPVDFHIVLVYQYIIYPNLLLYVYNNDNIDIAYNCIFKKRAVGSEHNSGKND